MATIGGIVVPTGGAATGRRTLLDITNELARPYDAADTTIIALAADAFRSVVRRMNRKGCWPWELQDEDIAMVSGERFSTVAGAVKKPLAMHYLNSAGGVRDQRISYMSYDRFLEKFNLDIQSQTHTYTIPNLFETGQIRWYPTPSSNDNLRLSYYRVTPAPRNENEAVEIPDYVTEAYMGMAWYELLKRMPSEQRSSNLQMAKVDAIQAFREISAHVNQPGDRSRQINSSGYGYG